MTAFRRGVLYIQRSDGSYFEFEPPKTAGNLIVMVCGADTGYYRNDVRHSHYFLFEHAVYWYDGRYVLQLGSKAP